MRLGDFMAVTMKTTVLGDVTPYSLVLVYHCFGGKYCLNLQEQRVSQTSKQQTECRMACLFASLLAFLLAWLNL
jgi:hypothetical protein